MTQAQTNHDFLQLFHSFFQFAMFLPAFNFLGFGANRKNIPGAGAALRHLLMPKAIAGTKQNLQPDDDIKNAIASGVAPVEIRLQQGIIRGSFIHGVQTLHHLGIDGDPIIGNGQKQLFVLPAGGQTEMQRVFPRAVLNGVFQNRLQKEFRNQQVQRIGLQMLLIIDASGNK